MPKENVHRTTLYLHRNSPETTEQRFFWRINLILTYRSTRLPSSTRTRITDILTVLCLLIPLSFQKKCLIVVVRILYSLCTMRSPSKALYNLRNTSIIISHWPSARAIMSFVRLLLSDRQYVNNPYGIVTRTPSINQLRCTRRISLHSRSFDSSVNYVLLYRIDVRHYGKTIPKNVV